MALEAVDPRHTRAFSLLLEAAQHVREAEALVPDLIDHPEVYSAQEALVDLSEIVAGVIGLHPVRLAEFLGLPR